MKVLFPRVAVASARRDTRVTEPSADVRYQLGQLRKGVAVQDSLQLIEAQTGQPAFEGTAQSLQWVEKFGFGAGRQQGTEPAPLRIVDQFLDQRDFPSRFTFDEDPPPRPCGVFHPAEDAASLRGRPT